MPGQFAQHAGNRGAHQVRPTVASVGSDHIVVGTQGALHANSAGLLARVQVTEASNLFLLVHGARRGFETSNGQHLTVEEQRIVFVHGDLSARTIGQLVHFEVLKANNRLSDDVNNRALHSP